MNEKESVENDIYRAALAELKKNFLRRLNRYGLITYGWGAPEDICEFLNDAHLCYLHGIFIASILMASTAVENALRTSYHRKTKKKYKGNFEYLIQWAQENSIITEGNAHRINVLRKSIRNKLVHMRPFSEDEVNTMYELQERGFETLNGNERNMLALYLLRTQPSERLAEKVLEIADEITEHLFPSIGRLPFP
jgi:hypothetical protein